MKISQKIKELRKNVRFTQKEFAEKIGVNTKTIAFWETEKNEPTKSNILTICNKFDLPEDFFEEYVNIKNKKEKQISSDEIIKIPYWAALPNELKHPEYTFVLAQRVSIEQGWGVNPDDLCIIPMVGDKMTKYWYPINDGDILIIDTSKKHIVGNGVYFATSQNNTRFWVREMQNLYNNDIEFKGFAPSGNTVRTVSKEELQKVGFTIIGKVIKNVSFRL